MKWETLTAENRSEFVFIYIYIYICIRQVAKVVPGLKTSAIPEDYNALVRRKTWGTDGCCVLQVATPFKQNALGTFRTESG